MSRNPSQGSAAVARNVQTLMKIKVWITLDPKRSEPDRRKLDALLDQIITLLLNGKRDALAKQLKQA